MSVEYDLVVRGGTIIDGTGAEPFAGDVAVKDGKIKSIASGTGCGIEEIDARDKIVTPGFVDIHTHYDGQVTWESRLEPSSQHGVTSVVIGNCGVGFAPCRRDQHELLIRLMEGVEDIPHPVLVEGLPWTWESYPEYLDTIGARNFDVDVGALVPHAALRVFVMGERGVNREAATTQDREAMAALFADCLKAGALGIGTSRTLFHRSSDGNLIPTLEAEEEELQAFAEVIGKAKTGMMQIVSDFRDGLGDLMMMKRLAERSGRPVTFTFGEMDESGAAIMSAVEEARRQGVLLKPQLLGRSVGMLLGYELTLNPFCTCPTYKALSSLSFKDKVSALKTPQMRARILSEQPDPNEKQMLARLVSGFDTMFEMESSPNYEPALEDSIASRAKRMGISPQGLAYDVMLKRDGKVMLYVAIANYTRGNLDRTGKLLEHPDVVFGLGDGGAHCATICDASYSTFALMHWGRDRKRGTLPLPLLVQRMSSATARTVGLYDRGVIAPGFRADLNVIEFQRLSLHAPELSYDLPAGGRRLVQRAEGYDATIVDGVITYQHGEPTGALPGRLIRGGQPAPAGAR